MKEGGAALAVGKSESGEKYAKYINSVSKHYISNSGFDENGGFSDGEAGDQTGREWELRSWYNRPWSCVLRYPDQGVALKIAELGNEIRQMRNMISIRRHAERLGC